MRLGEFAPALRAMKGVSRSPAGAARPVRVHPASLRGGEVHGPAYALDTSGFLGARATDEYLRNVDLVSSTSSPGSVHLQPAGSSRSRADPAVRRAPREHGKAVWVRYVLVPADRRYGQHRRRREVRRGDEERRVGRGAAVPSARLVQVGPAGLAYTLAETPQAPPSSLRGSRAVPRRGLQRPLGSPEGNECWRLSGLSWRTRRCSRSSPPSARLCAGEDLDRRLLARRRAVLFSALGWRDRPEMRAAGAGELDRSRHVPVRHRHSVRQAVLCRHEGSGLKWNLLAAVGVVGALAVALALGRATGVSTAYSMGLFAGSLTSTPTLQAALDAAGNRDPAIGYSVAYPFGVIARSSASSPSRASSRRGWRRRPLRFSRSRSRSRTRRRHRRRADSPAPSGVSWWSSPRGANRLPDPQIKLAPATASCSSASPTGCRAPGPLSPRGPGRLVSDRELWTWRGCSYRVRGRRHPLASSPSRRGLREIAEVRRGTPC